VTRRAVALALGTHVAASCSLPVTPSANQGLRIPDIVIASDLPLTGPLGLVAGPLRDAIALAVGDQGSVSGYRLAYASFDDALIGTFNFDKGQQNVKLMIGDSRVVALIGPFNSDEARAEIPLANQAGLGMISPSNTKDCLTFTTDPCRFANTTQVNSYFRTSAADSAQASAMARFAVGTLHVKRFAVLDDGSGYGTNIAGAFADSLVAAGGSVALQTSFSETSNSVTTLLHQAVGNGAEAVYVGGAAVTGACKLRAAMNVVFPAGAYMLGGDGLSGPGCAHDAGIAAGGTDEHLLMTVSDSQPPSDSKVYKEFQAHNIPLVSYVFGAYDCAEIIIDAIGRAIRANGGKVPTRLQVLDAIAATRDFPGTTGTFTFHPDGDAIHPAVSVYRVEGGRWTFWESAPQASS
jgi:branched-chain amino acid transport system substrate-binding protein